MKSNDTLKEQIKAQYDIVSALDDQKNDAQFNFEKQNEILLALLNLQSAQNGLLKLQSDWESFHAFKDMIRDAGVNVLSLTDKEEYDLFKEYEDGGCKRGFITKLRKRLK